MDQNLADFSANKTTSQPLWQGKRKLIRDDWFRESSSRHRPDFQRNSETTPLLAIANLPVL
jgi:hypothetical protein